MDTTDNRQIEYMALGELMTRLHPQNPKSHDLGAIIQSYQTHGFVASGILDDRTGLFLAGHGRIQALNMMRKQGMGIPDGIRNGGDDWLVPVQVGYSSKNDIQAKAYIVADNKLTVLGGWDEPKLATLLQEVAGSVEVALEATGYDADELSGLLAQVEYDSLKYGDEFSQKDMEGVYNSEVDTSAFIVYVSFKTEEEFVSGLKLLSKGERNENREGMRYAAIDGSALLPEWENMLGDDAE